MSESQRMSGVPCLAFPLHEHRYQKFISETTTPSGEIILMYKCAEVFCNATHYITTEGDNADD